MVVNHYLGDARIRFFAHWQLVADMRTSGRSLVICPLFYYLLVKVFDADGCFHKREYTIEG
jgi:hypothetical protein